MTFAATLARWLVKQRWFAGTGRTVHDLAVVADTGIIPGDPGLRHLMVTVSHGATSDCYQLFIGYRARLPARLRHARIGTQNGLQIYDGLHDTALTRTLLDAIVDDRSVGMLRFCRMRAGTPRARPGGSPRPPRRCTGTWPTRSAGPSSSRRPFASWPSRCTGGSTWPPRQCPSWPLPRTRSATPTRTWPS